MSDPEKEDQAPSETDESREPLLTPDHVTDADTEFRKEELAEEAAHGLDQLEGPEIEAVMQPGAEEEDAGVEQVEEQPRQQEAETGDEELDDLFDPPGYYDVDSEGPVDPEDEDVGVRDTEVDGPRKQVGEAAHNPPIGEAPKQGKEEEDEE